MSKNNNQDQNHNLYDKFKFKIYNYVVHYARVYNYNDETYKWRYVIPIKKVYNSWIVLPLFTEKNRFSKMKNYFLINELSDDKNVYVDLSRQDKILVNEKNFEKEPHKVNGKLKNIKKSTIKLIQEKQNSYLYGAISIIKISQKKLNKVLINSLESESNIIKK